MKKMMIICAVLALAATFTSCKKNNLGELVAGTYNGYTVANCQYFSDELTENENLIVKDNGNNQVEITFNSESWGTYTIKGAEVVQDGKSYKIGGSGSCEMTGMGGGPAQTHDCTVDALVKDKNTATFTFKVPSVMGGLTVEFTTGILQSK